MRIKTIIAYIFFGFILAIIVFISAHVLVDAYNEACNANNNAAQNDCSAYNVLFIWFRHLFNFTKTYSEAITVLATVMIAFFTWRLFVSTDKLWKETKNTSESTGRYQKALERSYLAIDKFAIVNFSAGQKPYGQFQVINSGRVPAEIVEQCIAYTTAFSISAHPIYDKAEKLLPSLVSPQNFISSPVHWREPLYKEEYELVTSRVWCVFIWGKIKYKDILSEDIHETEFGTKAVWQGIKDTDGFDVWRFEIISGYSRMT